MLADAIHYERSATTFDDIAALPREWLHYAQFCDAPAGIPDTMDEILRQARFERKLPGEGGIDLRGLMDVLPAEFADRARGVGSGAHAGDGLRRVGAQGSRCTAQDRRPLRRRRATRRLPLLLHRSGRAGDAVQGRRLLHWVSKHGQETRNETEISYGDGALRSRRRNDPVFGFGRSGRGCGDRRGRRRPRGHAVSGRDGALVGGALGAVAGYHIGKRHHAKHRHHVSHRYYQRPVRHYHRPARVYYAPAAYSARPVYTTTRPHHRAHRHVHYVHDWYGNLVRVVSWR